MLTKYYVRNSCCVHDTDDVKEKFNIEIKPSYNITPSQEVLVYDGKLHYMKWAYNPYWSDYVLRKMCFFT